MKKKILLPYYFKTLGYILVLPFLALGIAYIGWGYTVSWLDFSITNFTDELAAIGLIISLFFVAFSKEKIEDEAIQFFRLEALQLAVYANYAVLLLAVIFCYGTLFFTIMTINLFTVLFIFILRFRYVLYQHNKISL